MIDKKKCGVCGKIFNGFDSIWSECTVCGASICPDCIWRGSTKIVVSHDKTRVERDTIVTVSGTVCRTCLGEYCKRSVDALASTGLDANKSIPIRKDELEF